MPITISKNLKIFIISPNFDEVKTKFKNKYLLIKTKVNYEKFTNSSENSR